MWWCSIVVGLLNFAFLIAWPRILVLEPDPLHINNETRAILSTIACIFGTRGILEAIFKRRIKPALLIASIGGMTFALALNISFLVVPPFPPGMLEKHGATDDRPTFRGFDSLSSDVTSSLERGRQRMNAIQDFFSSLGPTRFWQNVSNLGLLAGVLGALSHGFLSLKEQESIMNIYQGPVDNRQINTGDHSPVAMDHGVVDSGNHSSFSGEIKQAIGQVQSSIDRSDADDRDKRYATLLLDKLQREALAPRRDKEKVNSTLKELGQVLEGAKPIAEAATNAMKVLKDIFG
jgi:hypothetical protein